MTYAPMGTATVSMPAIVMRALLCVQRERARRGARPIGAKDNFCRRRDFKKRSRAAPRYSVHFQWGRREPCLALGGLLARFLSARALEHLAFVLTSRGRTASKKP